MKVLLINPSPMPYAEQEAFLNKTSVLRVPTFSMPLGYLDLVGFVRQEVDCDFEIIDLGADLYEVYLSRENREPYNIESFLYDKLNQVSVTPNIVGLSLLFASSHSSSIRLANMAKELWPNCKVLFGGNHATNIYQSLLDEKNIDFR